MSRKMVVCPLVMLPVSQKFDSIDKQTVTSSSGAGVELPFKDAQSYRSDNLQKLIPVLANPKGIMIKDFLIIRYDLGDES